MGNENCCAGDRKGKKSAFPDTERQALKKLWDDIADKGKQAGRKGFSEESLSYLFPENPDMSGAIYNFIKCNAKGEEITYEIVEKTLEILMKEPADFQLKEYRNMEKIDLLAYLVANDYATDKEELKYSKINTNQAAEFSRFLLKIFNADSPEIRISDDAIQQLVDGVFNSTQGKVTWWTLIQYFKSNFLYINRCLKAYWTNKFMPEATPAPRLPEQSGKSELLSRDDFITMYLSNVFFQTISKFDIIYSSPTSSKAGSFEKLVKLLIEYQGPTYVLMKVSGPQGASVIGGFSRLQFENNSTYMGDSDCYISQFRPRYNNYYALITQTGFPNFTYLNTFLNGKPVGLGFGGDMKGDFRIFLDGKDPGRSYLNANDNTYEPGPLIEGKSTQVRIEYVEVIGFGEEYTVLKGERLIRKTQLTRQSWVDTYQASQPKFDDFDTLHPKFNETEFFIRDSISKVTADRMGVPTYQRRTLPINPDDIQVKPKKMQQEVFYDDIYNKPPSPKEETKKKAARKFEPDDEPRTSKHAYEVTSRKYESLKISLDARKSAMPRIGQQVRDTSNTFAIPNNQNVTNNRGGTVSYGGYYDPFQGKNVKHDSEPNGEYDNLLGQMNLNGKNNVQ